MPAPAKYIHVKEQIRDRTRKMAVGTKIPAIQTLHEELGVSQGTIIRAINELVEEGHLEHRQNRGAYVAAPGQSARHMRVVWPDITELITRAPLSRHSLTAVLLHALQSEAARLDRDLLITPTLATDTSAMRNETSGALVLFSYDKKGIEALREQGAEVVLVGPLLRVPGVPFVTSDDFANMIASTNLLITKGHERIMHVTVDHHLAIPSWPGAPNHITDYYPRERERGYRAAMEQADRADNACVFRAKNTEWTEADARAFIAELKKQKVTACTCFNDDIAVRVLHACQEAGMHVPDDIAIVGHDDLGVAAQARPAITSLRVPIEPIGRTAVQLLHSITTGEADAAQSAVLSGQITERETT